MSFETDVRIPATEPSLLDVFGPNISDQVKMTNLRAAELSMDDMAKVLNPSGASNGAGEDPINDAIHCSVSVELIAKLREQAGDSESALNPTKMIG